VRAAVLTVSDGVAAGSREDLSGDLLEKLLAGEGYEVGRRVVADDADEIAEAIGELAREAALVLTTGGTGVAPRDVTPEATLSVLDREAPGIAEALRAASLAVTPFAMLSRAAAGLIGKVLVVNLPGNPKAVGEEWVVLEPVLRHAVETAAGPVADETHRHR
jgi:molybdopterin adenylyltransferase